MDIIITAHGKTRISERAYGKKGDLQNYLSRIWKEGKTENSFGDRIAIKKYLTNVRNNGGSDRSIRVKGNTLFVFNYMGTVFLTCYDIPQKVLQDHRNKRR